MDCYYRTLPITSLRVLCRYAKNCLGALEPRLQTSCCLCVCICYWGRKCHPALRWWVLAPSKSGIKLNVLLSLGSLHINSNWLCSDWSERVFSNPLKNKTLFLTISPNDKKTGKQVTALLLKAPSHYILISAYFTWKKTHNGTVILFIKRSWSSEYVESLHIFRC